MHSFHYQRGKLTCESYSLDKAAEHYGTPLYVYSSQTITDHYQRLDKSLRDLSHQICYAVKANSNLAVVRLLAEHGAGFDIVSGGELYRVIKAGGNPLKCTFAGVGKSREEIEYALRSEVLSFNVESEQELTAISEIAKSLHKRAPIAIRVNPGVSANTHKYISTGKRRTSLGSASIALRRFTGGFSHYPMLRSAAYRCTLGPKLSKRNRSSTRSKKCCRLFGT